MGLWIVGGAEGLKRDAFVRACGNIVYLMVFSIESAERSRVSFLLKYVERHLIRMPRRGDSDEMTQNLQSVLMKGYFKVSLHSPRWHG